MKWKNGRNGRGLGFGWELEGIGIWERGEGNVLVLGYEDFEFGFLGEARRRD